MTPINIRRQPTPTPPSNCWKWFERISSEPHHDHHVRIILQALPYIFGAGTREERTQDLGRNLALRDHDDRRDRRRPRLRVHRPGGGWPAHEHARRRAAPGGTR